MTDNVTLPAASGKAASREVTYSGETAQAQVVGLAAFSGSDDAKTAADIGGDATNGLDVDVTRVPTDPFGANADAASATGSISAKLRAIAATGIPVTSISAGDNNIGNVDIVTVPADPFGANADAASATGSISAKLRYLAATGIAGMTALPTGSNAIGKLAANSGVDIGDVDVTSIAAGTNLIGDVDIAPRTTGGWSVANLNGGDTYTALTNSAQVVKGSAGKVGGWVIWNPNTVVIYVMLYNIAAASVTVGTSTATMIIPVPPASLTNIELLAGVPFGTAIAAAAATTAGGNGAPTTALDAMIFYK